MLSLNMKTLPVRIFKLPSIYPPCNEQAEVKLRNFKRNGQKQGDKVCSFAVCENSSKHVIKFPRLIVSSQA